MPDKPAAPPPPETDDKNETEPEFGKPGAPGEEPPKELENGFA